MKITKKRVLVGLVILFIGFSMGTGTVKVKEVTKEVPAKSEAEWRKLKEIDDTGFTKASEGLTLCGTSFNAIAEGDLKTVESNTKRMNEIAKEMFGVSSQRLEVLTKLGY